MPTVLQGNAKNRCCGFEISKTVSTQLFFAVAPTLHDSKAKKRNPKFCIQTCFQNAQKSELHRMSKKEEPTSVACCVQDHPGEKLLDKEAFDFFIS
jgi:hypothetical protein